MKLYRICILQPIQMDLRQLLSVLEDIPELSSFISTAYDDAYNMIMLAYRSDIKANYDIDNTFKVMSRVDYNILSELDEDNIQYPSMVYNDHLSGHFVVLLSPNEALIHEFGYSYQTDTSEEAIEFMKDKVDNGYLDNPPGGILYTVSLKSEINVNDLIDEINQSYVTMMGAISIEPDHLITTHEDIVHRDYQDMNLSSIRANVMVTITELRESILLALSELGYQG